MFSKKTVYHIDSFFKRFEVKNCLVCALCPLNLVPFLPIKGYCPHSHLKHFNTKSTYFKVEKFNQFICAATSIIMLIGSLFNVNLLYQKCGNDKGMCFLHIFNLFYGLGGVLLSHFASMRVHLYCKYTNGWISTLENGNKYGFPVLITPTNCRDILVHSLCAYLTVFAIFPPLALGGLFFPHEESDHYFLVHFGPTAFSGCIQILENILFTQVALFEYKIACNVRDHIIKVMSKRAINYGDITENLKLFTNFFQLRHMNFKSLITYLHPVFSTWIFFSIICLITNFYLLIDQWYNNDHYFVANFIYLEIRSYVVVCSLIYMMFIVDVYDKVCKNLCPFHFIFIIM